MNSYENNSIVELINLLCVYIYISWLENNVSSTHKTKKKFEEETTRIFPN